MNKSRAHSLANSERIAALSGMRAFSPNPISAAGSSGLFSECALSQN